MDAQPLRYPWPDPPAPGEATEIAPGVLWFRLPLPMKLDHVNVFALDDGPAWTIVDTGLGSSQSRALWSALLAGPLAGKPVARVLLTHHHPDHTGNAGWFAAELGAELLATRTAWLFTRMLQLDAQESPPEEMLLFWRRAGMDPEIYETRRHERPFSYAEFTWPLPLGFTRIGEGDSLRIGGRDWVVHLGHGHAPDHATLWSQSDRLVIGGDQFLPSISPNLGVHPAEPEADPVGEWLESCTRLSAFARDDQLVLPGHKLPFTGLPARLTQLIDNHHTALERLLDFLSEPRTAHQCFPPLYRRQIGKAEYGLALIEAIGHLNHLLRLGRVTRTPGPADAWLWQRI